MKYSQPMTNRTSRDFQIFKKENHDNCTECGYAFKNGDTNHVGYGKNDFFMNTCDNCSFKLTETSVRHIFRKHAYSIPAKETKLWRYLDFAKYVSLLNTKALYFSNAAMFEDPFEGAKGLLERKEIWDKHYLDFLKEAVRTVPNRTTEISEEEVNKQADKLLLDLNKSGESSRKRTFINCWHENDFESEAMWRLYSRDNYSAIAVQTTYQRLYESFDRDPSINIGKVNYIDYSNQFTDINDAYWYKRMSFSHEREVRAIKMNYAKQEAGLAVPVNLEILIENIYISPLAQSWLTNLIIDINSKFGISKDVHKSSINQTPFY